jgi:predicted HAD superfamily phosphohydrolase
VADLDDLFWSRMDGRVSGAMVAAVRPVGGGQKLAALEQIVAAEGVEGGGVMYVGDSITDAPPLEAVKAWGGAALSFNGNGYAIAAAEFAAASPDAEVQAQLAQAFFEGGRDAVEAAVRAWPKPKKGTRPTGKARAAVGLVAEERERLTEASAAARLSVRGERVARLG